MIAIYGVVYNNTCDKILFRTPLNRRCNSRWVNAIITLEITAILSHFLITIYNTVTIYKPLNFSMNYPWN